MTKKTTKKAINLEDDFSHLARVALTGRPQDVQMLIQRAIKSHQGSMPKLAESLTHLLREAPTRASPLRRQTSTTLPVDSDSRLHLVRVEENLKLDFEPVYSCSVKEKLDRIVSERNKADNLLKAGLEPTRTVIFTGPPGVGKTLTARWLARELNKPLMILDLAAVMSSYLGRTGTNLRQVLEYAKSVDCVLLLDELDAIAKRRDDGSEIGELKRLVTVLIQQIDDWPSTGLLIAATNHAELLDPAIWRRFEDRIEFPLPNTNAASVFIQNRLSGHSIKDNEWSKILATALKGHSFSDLERKINSARRSAAINGDDIGNHLIKMVQTGTISKKERADLASDLVLHKVCSQRHAHDLTGVARETIRSHVAKKQEQLDNCEG